MCVCMLIFRTYVSFQMVAFFVVLLEKFSSRI